MEVQGRLIYFNGDENKKFLKKYPHVYKWYKRMLMRDSVKDVLNLEH